MHRVRGNRERSMLEPREDCLRAGITSRESLRLRRTRSAKPFTYADKLSSRLRRAALRGPAGSPASSKGRPALGISAETLTGADCPPRFSSMQLACATKIVPRYFPAGGTAERASEALSARDFSFTRLPLSFILART